MKASAAVQRWAATNARFAFCSCSWFPRTHSIARNRKLMQSSQTRRLWPRALLDTGSTGFPLGGARLQLRDDVAVVLVEPQIPPNAGTAPPLQASCLKVHEKSPAPILNARWLAAGNAARTCAAARVAMHVVRPLGFDLDSKRCVHVPSTLPQRSSFATCAGENCTHSTCPSAAA
jgi:hypothetical protein